MSENENQPPPRPDDKEKTSIRNDARFWVATVLIVGMLIILTIAVLQNQYTQTTQLAAIFSGWITSIIAFYFYTQTSTQLQDQIKASANQEERTHTRKTALVQYIRGIISDSEMTIKSLTEANRAKATQETIELIKTRLDQEEP